MHSCAPWSNPRKFRTGVIPEGEDNVNPRFGGGQVSRSEWAIFV